MFERLFGEKFSRFRLGQIIFAAAVSFGLFAGDIIRIVLGVLALFFLTKENFKFNWTRGQKITGCILALFCAWMIVIPVIFGENPLPVRLRDAVRPVELTLWICATLLFAKDEFFVRNLKNFSITACFLYSLIALHWCVETHFALDQRTWPIIHNCYVLGCLVIGTSAWCIYEMLTGQSVWKNIFCIVVLVEAMLLTAFSRVVTYYAAELTVLFAALVLSFCVDKRKFARFALLLLVISGIGLSILHIGMQKNPTIKSAIQHELEQIRFEKTSDFDADRFTNHRSQIWDKAINEIPRKPIFGHGLYAFIKYKPEGMSMDITHAHCTFLQTAFACGIPCAVLLVLFLAMIFILAAKRLCRMKPNIDFSFTVLLVLAEFVPGALVENLTVTTDRNQVTLFYTVFVTMLSMYNTSILEKK